MGGGDVKLLTVAVLWAGAGHSLDLLLLTALIGGGLALFLLTPYGLYASTVLQHVVSAGPATGPAADDGGKPRVPYAVPIAAAAIALMFPGLIPSGLVP